MDEAGIRRWQVGAVTITRIIEGGIVTIEPDFLLIGAAAADVQQVPWLCPDFATPDGQITLAFQTFVVEAGGRRIIVDTCNGNDKERGDAWISRLKLPFLERLAEAGYPAETIDTVLCTHLHVDHVGWNTKLVDGRWVPTFPNARYLFGRREWEHWSGYGGELQFGDYMADSVRPIVDAGLADLVEADLALTPEVRLEPTHGHTPGHVSLRISSRGHEAIITGDMMHHPMQCARPELSTHFCSDPAAARATRIAALKRWSDGRVLVLGTHFGGPVAGTLTPEGAGYRLVTA